MRKEYELAQKILGADFFPPEEITDKCEFELTYTEDQMQTLAETIPNEQQLIWCKENNYILVAGPPEKMTFLEMSNKFKKMSDNGRWSWEEMEWSKECNANPGWLPIRKNFVQRTSWKEITANPTEVVWAMIVTYSVQDKFFIEKGKYLRTYSGQSNWQNVIIGVRSSDRDRISVSSDLYDRSKGAPNVGEACTVNLNDLPTLVF